ncbi:MAG: phage integrase N-terminal SAM-like domain-containing protein [Azonexus sp.]|nr:phage integrase N-terminal SAM-like domain-containing protein [Azonexus sp.]
MTTKEAVTSLLQQRKYSHRTVESYVGWFDRLSSYFHGRTVDELDAEDIASYF